MTMAIRQFGTFEHSAAGSGWGTGEYNDFPWGGARYEVTDLPEPVLGGDYQSGYQHRKVYEVEAKRHGFPVQRFVVMSVRRWDFRWIHLTATQVESLRLLFEDRRFDYYPEYDTNPSLVYTVWWLDDEFDPKPTRAGTRYSLKAVWEEVR